MFSSVDSPASMITVGSGECAGLGDVAGQHLAAQREAGLIERQAEGDQGAVIAALLGAPELQVAAGAAVIVDVSEVDED